TLALAHHRQKIILTARQVECDRVAKLYLTIRIAPAPQLQRLDHLLAALDVNIIGGAGNARGGNHIGIDLDPDGEAFTGQRFEVFKHFAQQEGIAVVEHRPFGYVHHGERPNTPGEYERPTHNLLRTIP